MFWQLEPASCFGDFWPQLTICKFSRGTVGSFQHTLCSLIYFWLSFCLQGTPWLCLRTLPRLFPLLELLNTRVTPFRQRKWSESPPLSETRAIIYILGHTSAIRTPDRCMKSYCETINIYNTLLEWYQCSMNKLMFNWRDINVEWVWSDL